MSLVGGLCVHLKSSLLRKGKNMWTQLPFHFHRDLSEATGQWAEMWTGCPDPRPGLTLTHAPSQESAKAELPSLTSTGRLFFLPGANPRAVLQSRVRGRQERHLWVIATCLLPFCARGASLALPWPGAAVPESHSSDLSPGRTLCSRRFPSQAASRHYCPGLL